MDPSTLREHLTEQLAAGGLTAAQLAGLTAVELGALAAYAVERLDAGQDSEAAALLAGLLVLDPTVAAWWRAYGVALQRLNHLERAVQAYDAALALEPGVPYVYAYRAEAWLLLGQAAAAASDLAALAGHERHPGLAAHLPRVRHLRYVLDRQRAAVATEAQPQTTGSALLGAAAAWPASAPPPAPAVPDQAASDVAALDQATQTGPPASTEAGDHFVPPDHTTARVRVADRIARSRAAQHAAATAGASASDPPGEVTARVPRAGGQAGTGEIPTQRVRAGGTPTAPLPGRGRRRR